MADSKTSSSALDSVDASRPESIPAAFLIDLGLAVAALFLAAANLYLGRFEFGGYDLSVLIDSGWRITIGQIPTASFICTLPPSFYLLAAAAFRIFGIRWSSLLDAESLLYLLLCFLGLRLCRLLRSVPQGNHDHALPLIYIAAQSLVLLSVNHLWHSATASAVAAYAILATYALIRLAPSRPGREAAVHVAFAFAFLLLSKPNTAWPAVLLCLLCLMRDRRRWHFALLAIAAAVVADVILLTALRISLFDAFGTYMGLGSRAVPNLFFVGINPETSPIGLITVAPTYVLLLPIALGLIVVICKERSRILDSPANLLAVSAAVVSIVGLATNWELKIVDVAPLLVGVAVAAGTSEERYKLLLRPMFSSAVLFVVFAALLGIYRARMIGVGPWAGADYGPMVRIHDGFFGDFTARLYFTELLVEADTVTPHLADRKIFFGPRLEFLYARDKLPSPVHLPIWWHPGTSYPLGLEAKAVQAWEDDNFDVLIFAKNDRTRLPHELLSFIAAHYTRSPNYVRIDVFYRK